MLLTIDIGNTNLTLGLYEGDQLGAHWRLATDNNRMPDEYGLQLLGLLQNAGKTLKEINGISLASVVPPLTGRVIQACREYLKQEPLVVDTGIKTGIKIRYEDPKAVGADRVCDAVAVMKLYGGPASWWILELRLHSTPLPKMANILVERSRRELISRLKLYTPAPRNCRGLICRFRRR